MQASTDRNPSSSLQAPSAPSSRPALPWFVGGAALLVLMILLVQRSERLQARGQLEQDARVILDAAVNWRRQNALLGCPTISQLIQDRFLTKSARADDPWGRRYRIRCSADEVHVESLGKDGVPASDDDIRFNQAASVQPS
jgi:hypothetical protein